MSLSWFASIVGGQPSLGIRNVLILCKVDREGLISGFASEMYARRRRMRVLSIAVSRGTHEYLSAISVGQLFGYSAAKVRSVLQLSSVLHW